MASPQRNPFSPQRNVPDDDDDDLSDAAPAAGASGSAQPSPPQIVGMQASDLQAMQAMVMSLAQTTQQTLSVVAQQSAQLQQRSSERSASSGPSSGFNLANKVLKYPEAFGTENADQDALGWLAWSTSFRNWVTFAEPAYESDLGEIESRLTEVPHISQMPVVCVERARKLYVILSSLLRGRPLAILRGIDDRNGYECWRQLTNQFSPRTRSRSLAMLSAIMGLPAFTRDRTLREQLMGFERLVAEYEKASGNQLPADVKLSVVLKAIPKTLQSHVHLRMDTSTSYDDVKSLVLSYEVSTTNWTASRIQQELGLVNPGKGNCPVSMEVDQEGSVAQVKGKDGKGKQGKGKDKGKGKSKDGKGKGKDPPNPKAKPKAKAKSNPDVVCHYCHKKGHYQRDCRKLKSDQASGKVRAVTEDGQTDAPHDKPSLQPAAKASVKRITFDIRGDAGGSACSSVRAINLNPCQHQDSNPCQHQDSNPCQHQDSNPCQHQDSNPCQHQDSNPCQHQDSNPCQHQDSNPCQHQDSNPCQRQDSNPCQHQDSNPCQHQDSNPCQHQDSNPCQHQDSNPCQHQDLNPCQHQDPNPCQHQVPNPREVNVPCFQVPRSSVCLPDRFDMTVSDDDDCWDLSPASTLVRVAVVSASVTDQQVEVCVDTAADESCLPLSFGNVGQHVSGERALVDCQGNPMRTCGSRLAKLEASGIELMERWVISPVGQPILAAGKLLKQGWRMLDVEGSGLCLVSPGQEAHIPVWFNNNTLVCSGVVRAISEPHPPALVRAVAVKVSGLLDRLLNSADYFQEIAPGVFATSLTSKCHVDLGLYLPYEGLSYRTTLCKIDNDWVLSEHSQPLESLDDSELTQQVSEHEVEMIVFGHREPLSPSELGFSTEPDQPVSAPLDIPVDPLLEDLQGEVEGLQPDSVGGGAVDELGGAAIGGPGGGGSSKDQHNPDALMLEALADEPSSELAAIVVDDVELSLDSTLSTLRKACQSLGVGKSGSKAVVFRRLKDRLNKLKLLESLRATEVPNAPVPQVPAAPKEPTPEERRLHNATHAPFASWCTHCVAHKSRDDPHRASSANRSTPVVSFDFGFTSRIEGEKTLPFLAVYDSETGWREAIPVPGKAGVHGGINVTSYLAAELCRLLSMLGYSKVDLRCDPEPTCLRLRNEVKRMRLQMGLKTDVTQAPEDSHQSNGGAEVTVKTVRQQCNTLLAQYEAETKLEVGTFHALHAWCLRHAAWILNRYVLRPGGLTPYEIVHGRPYKGKILPFGECVMGLVSQGAKGKARFVQALMLGKCAPNDEWVLCTTAGRLLLARTVRRMEKGFNPALHDCIKLWLSRSS